MHLLNFEGCLLLCNAFPETVNTSNSDQPPDYRIEVNPRPITVCVSNVVGCNMAVVPITSQPGELCVPISLQGGGDAIHLCGEQDALGEGYNIDRYTGPSYLHISKITMMQWGTRDANGNHILVQPVAGRRGHLEALELARLRQIIAIEILRVPVPPVPVILVPVCGDYGGPVYNGPDYGGVPNYGYSGAPYITHGYDGYDRGASYQYHGDFSRGGGYRGQSPFSIPLATPEQVQRFAAPQRDFVEVPYSFDNEMPTATPKQMAAVTLKGFDDGPLLYPHH